MHTIHFSHFRNWYYLYNYSVCNEFWEMRKKKVDFLCFYNSYTTFRCCFDVCDWQQKSTHWGYVAIGFVTARGEGEREISSLQQYFHQFSTLCLLVPKRKFCRTVIWKCKRSLVYSIVQFSYEMMNLLCNFEYEYWWHALWNSSVSPPVFRSSTICKEGATSNTWSWKGKHILHNEWKESHITSNKAICGEFVPTKKIVSCLWF